MSPRRIAASAIWVDPRLKRRSTRMPGAFERLRVDLGDHERFGEVFRTHADGASARPASGQSRTGGDAARAHARAKRSRGRLDQTPDAPEDEFGARAPRARPTTRRAKSGAGSSVCSPRTISSPSPPAPMNVASVALAIVSVAAVRKPANEIGSASGTTTRRSVAAASCPCRRPRRVPLAGTPRIPRSTLMTIGGIASSASATIAGAVPTPRQRQQQHQHCQARKRAADPGQGQGRAANAAPRSRPRSPRGTPATAARTSAQSASATMLPPRAPPNSPHMGAGLSPAGGETRWRLIRMIELQFCPNAVAAAVSLDDPSLYISRELSWLEFNDRVLEEALDARNPLLERLKFVAIYGTNLDEFFMIRVAAIKQQIEAQVVRRSDDGRTPAEHLLGDLRTAARLAAHADATAQRRAAAGARSAKASA